MTIIVTAANHDYLMQFSDRRLSSAGVVVTDQSNKATVLPLANGRFAVGFTGMARVGTFEFQSWLVDALYRSAPPDYGIVETAERLGRELNSLFNNRRQISRLSPILKRLTVMMSGYLYAGARAYIGTIWLTNFQDFVQGVDHPEAAESFDIAHELEPEDCPPVPSYIQRVGAWDTMTQEDERILRNVLESSPSQMTMLDAGINIVRRIAERPRSGNSVGKNVAVVVIPRDRNLEISTRIRLGNGRNDVLLVDSVQAAVTPTGESNLISIRDIKIEVQQPVANKAAFQAVLGPNDPCWCNSNLRFKHCHGRALSAPMR
ncbi:SEC-C domain-containing protein [Paraburkholderia sp. GAS32]|uniref:SEC-C domain-containing protein n=1 Tax=Paraburkholderia sp. GAS32 TaxID=3035129 RepID=UPI003D208A5D